MFKRLKPKSEFFKNVLTLMTGTTIAQLIPIFASPILTRLYSPDDFGILALYLSVLLIISIFATGRYELALPLATEDTDANNLLASISLISVFISLLMIIILIMFSTLLLNYISNNFLNLLYIMPLNIIFMSIFNGVQYWLNQKENFKQIAYNKIILNLLIASSQISIGFLLFSINGLVVGYIVGYVFVFLYILYTLKNIIKDILKTISLKIIVFNLIKYKDFPLVNTFHSLSDKIQSDGVIFLITYKFGFAVLGLYSMAVRSITMPAGLIGNAVGQVVFSKFSKIYNDTQNIELEVKSIIKKLFLFSTPLFIILFFVLPSLFSVIFGKEWQEAGVYAQILLPYIYLNFIVSPVSNIPLITKKVKSYFKFSLIGNIITLIVFIISIYLFNNFIISLSIFSLFRALYTLALLIWIIKISKKGRS